MFILCGEVQRDSVGWKLSTILQGQKTSQPVILGFGRNLRSDLSYNMGLWRSMKKCWLFRRPELMATGKIWPVTLWRSDIKDNCICCIYYYQIKLKNAVSIIAPGAYQMFEWCMCVVYLCIILVSLQLYKRMHNLDSKKKRKTGEKKGECERSPSSHGNVLKEQTGPVGILETVANLQEIRTDSRTGR